MSFGILDEVKMLPFSRTLIRQALETYKAEEIIRYIQEGLHDWIKIGEQIAELSDGVKRDVSDLIEFYNQRLNFLEAKGLDNYLATLKDDSELLSPNKGRY